MLLRTVSASSSWGLSDMMMNKVTDCQMSDENGDGVRLIGAERNVTGNGAFSERLSSACGREDCGL